MIETASDRPKDILVAAGEYEVKRVVLRLSFYCTVCIADHGASKVSLGGFQGLCGSSIWVDTCSYCMCLHLYIHVHSTSVVLL